MTDAKRPAAFVAAQQTSQMIDRKKELSTLHRAMCAPGQDTRVVIISGWGGLGKTRLLSEAGWHAGNAGIFPHRDPAEGDNLWQNPDTPLIASNILDFTDLHLHVFEDFVERLRRAIGWHSEASFTDYDAAHSAYRRRLKDQADFGSSQDAADKMRRAFFTDYAAIAEKHRIVLLLDTAEQLKYAGPEWLQPLLKPDDRQSSTRDRLIELLIKRKLPNTTLLLAGRPSIDVYFDELQKAADENDTFRLNRVELDTFKPANTQTYLNQLAADYRAHQGIDETEARPDDDIAANLDDLADDPDQMEVLHRYTGGKPVLLALFADVWAEAARIPEFLLDTPAEAEARLAENTLEALQFNIEAEFIRIIFSKPGDIRAQILTALVRARRGLDVDQLTFILGRKPNQDYSPDWQPDNPDLRKEIEREFDPKNPQALINLSFVKRGPYGRLILQDEMYRIYDRHMAANEPSRRAEAEARHGLFTQLVNMAKTERDDLKDRQHAFREDDEAKIRLNSPDDALNAKLPYQNEDAEDTRVEVADRLFEAEMERLHYKLRLAPDEGLNDAYLDLAEQFSRAGDLAYDMLTQVEVWRFVQYNPTEEYWRELIDLPAGITWAALEHTADANEAANWIKRFWAQKKYRHGIDFAEKLEQEIIPEQKPELQNVLQHSFFHAERRAWQEMCETYLGDDVEESIATLRDLAANLESLLETGFPDCLQYGLRPYVALNRLRRTIGYVYNSLGYSLNTLGRYREANRAYVNGLRHLRDTGFLTMEAVARNNNARVLSELGRVTRALRICRDGLELREKQGYEGPIAGSHSTLALIYNNGMRPELAWREAALARVYFLKLEDKRGLALALYHLAEALRRLAHGRQDSKLFEVAREAITESVRLFDELEEPLRRIEARIELGCFYRDYAQYLRPKTGQTPNPRAEERLRSNQNDALKSLTRAVELARFKYPRHQLDALVNMAWTHYYDGDITQAEQAIAEGVSLAEDITRNLAEQVEDYKPVCRIKRDALPPQPADTEPYIFLLLGKAHTVEARLRMDRFINYRDELRRENPGIERTERAELVHNAPEAQRLMKEAAESFLLALAYNKLYSPRSPYISVLFDRLYDYLKEFNAIELTDFYTHQFDLTHQPAKAKTVSPPKRITGYGIKLIRPDDLADMDIFLRESFGDFLPAEKHRPGAQEAKA